MPEVTLPGTIPGLLVPGCPVAFASLAGGWGGGPCIVLGPDPDRPGVWMISRPEGWIAMNEQTWCLSAPASTLALDLANPAGFAQALRWLSDKLCEPDGKYPEWDITPSIWSREPSGVGHWLPAEEWSGGWDWSVDNAFVIHTGPGITPIEALRLACLEAASE